MNIPLTPPARELEQGKMPYVSSQDDSTTSGFMTLIVTPGPAASVARNLRDPAPDAAANEVRWISVLLRKRSTFQNIRTVDNR